MRKINKQLSEICVLVSGASGIVGYGVARTLKGIVGNIIGTTIYDISPAECFCDTVLIAPRTDSYEYVEWLCTTISEYNVDLIIPTIEADVKCWNQNRARLESSGAFVLLNNSRLIELCLDKWEFFNELQKTSSEYRIDTAIEPDIERFSIPFILKKRCGYGSQGLVLVDNREKYEETKDAIGSELIMQEYVGDEKEEYTVSGFFDKESKLKALIMLRRRLSKNGYTDSAEVTSVDTVRDAVIKLAEIFKPIGPTNFQFRKKGEEWKLLEINPRISSATSIRAAFGYNEAEMCVRYFLLGEEIVQPAIRSGRAIRYIEDYIIYDSDNI